MLLVLVLRFSALQRAENSSIVVVTHHKQPALAVSVLFSEPKIPQFEHHLRNRRNPRGFQCSSASRKFLNSRRRPQSRVQCWFQCSSASRKFLNLTAQIGIVIVGLFQCSSASRKFLNICRVSTMRCLPQVSVLFSEPKIPQCLLYATLAHRLARFSALQRAENSSILHADDPAVTR